MRDKMKFVVSLLSEGVLFLWIVDLFSLPLPLGLAEGIWLGLTSDLASRVDLRAEKED